MNVARAAITLAIAFVAIGFATTPGAAIDVGVSTQSPEAPDYEPTDETEDKLQEARGESNDGAINDDVTEAAEEGPRMPGGIKGGQLPDATVSGEAGGVEVSASPQMPDGEETIKGTAKGAVTEQFKPWSGVGPVTGAAGAVKGFGKSFVEVDVDT